MSPHSCIQPGRVWTLIPLDALLAGRAAVICRPGDWKATVKAGLREMMQYLVIRSRFRPGRQTEGANYVFHLHFMIHVPCLSACKRFITE